MQAGFNGTDWLPIGKAASFLGFSVSYTRFLARQNKLPSHRYGPKAHRRFLLADLKKFRGENSETSSKPVLAILCRVSSRGQARIKGGAKQSSLDNQIQRVREAVIERWDKQTYEDADKFFHFGSGMNYDRSELLSLIDGILSGRYRDSYIVATDYSRIMRFGIALFQMLCNRGGVKEVVYTHPLDVANENESLVHEVLSVITHYTAKLSGAKAKKLLRVEVDPETIELCLNWTKNNFSFRYQEKQLEEMGILDVTGKKKVTRGVIRRVVMEQREALKLWNGQAAEGSFDSFFQKFIQRTGNDENQVSHKRLMDAYSKWCADGGYTPFSNTKISKIISGMSIRGRKSSTNTRIWCGVSMKMQKPSETIHYGR